MVFLITLMNMIVSMIVNMIVSMNMTVIMKMKMHMMFPLSHTPYISPVPIFL